MALLMRLPALSSLRGTMQVQHQRASAGKRLMALPVPPSAARATAHAEAGNRHDGLDGLSKTSRGKSSASRR